MKREKVRGIGGYASGRKDPIPVRSRADAQFAGITGGGWLLCDSANAAPLGEAHRHTAVSAKRGYPLSNNTPDWTPGDRR